jgi:glycosyltransferase involved in cell wall biosynthesis
MMNALVSEPLISDETLAIQKAGQSRECPFAINGRFLTQLTTGVQRYAREITLAIDEILGENAGSGTIVVPSSQTENPQYNALEVVPFGAGQGYAWEQFVLPFQSNKPILNLCNTASIFRTEQIVCIHDANIYQMPESFSFPFRSVYKMLHPLLAKRLMRVTTVSHFAADELAQFLPISRDQISVMPDGHEHVFRWNASASDIFERFPIKRPFVLLLGNRTKHKNANMIMELAADFDKLGVDLMVAGSSAGVFATTTAVSASNIRRLGFVSDDDLAALFSKALCLVFPSITEGFGLPIVEAMTLGCPVISSNFSCMPEICGDAALLASPRDPQLWIRHVQELLRSSNLRSELIERGKIQARQFSWRKSAQGYLDLLS